MEFNTETKRRPPFVEFYDEAEVDAVATQKNGYQTMKSADYVSIRPLGSKDNFVQRVDDWFKQIEEQAKNGTFERSWIPVYKQMYKEWKASGETPLNGMPIAQWAQLNKGQVLNLQAAGCRTVEDLAEWPDGELPRLGMGARALKEQALAWLKAGEKGKAAAVIEKLTVRNAELERRLERLEAMLGSDTSYTADKDPELATQAKAVVESLAEAPKKKSYYKPKAKVAAQE